MAKQIKTLKAEKAALMRQTDADEGQQRIDMEYIASLEKNVRHEQFENDKLNKEKKHVLTCLKEAKVLFKKVLSVKFHY